MADIAASPATVTTTAVTLPARKFTKLTIRVLLASGTGLFIYDRGEVVSPTKYSYLLLDKEALELDGANYTDGSKISIVTDGSATVIWSMQ